MKRLERMLAIEDLMYICILEKFQVRWLGGSWTASSTAVAAAAAAAAGSGGGVHSVDGSGDWPHMRAAAVLLQWRPCRATSWLHSCLSCCPWAAWLSHASCTAAPAPQEIGVDMLPRVEPVEESTSTLKALTGAWLVVLHA